MTRGDLVEPLGAIVIAVGVFLALGMTLAAGGVALILIGAFLVYTAQALAHVPLRVKKDGAE